MSEFLISRVYCAFFYFFFFGGGGGGAVLTFCPITARLECFQDKPCPRCQYFWTLEKVDVLVS